MGKTVKIEGMKCDGCVQTVTEKFSQIEGVTAVDVRLETKSATVTTNREVSNEELNKTLNDTKFSVAN